LSEQEFEVKFRQWLDQEGIAREMHSHLRVELIHCFNNTALGKILMGVYTLILYDITLNCEKKTLYIYGL